MHTAHGGELKTAGFGIEGRHRARAIDPDQPVGFRTADGGIGQRLIGHTFRQILEALADGTLRHRLQPQPLDRLLCLCELIDVAKNQLTFAARVAGVDDAIDVFALQQFEQNLQPVFGFLDRLQLKVGRNCRQMGKSPLAAFDLFFFRHADFDQMADGGREHEIVALEKIFLFREAPQRFGDVVGDGRFLGNDEGLAHKLRCS